MTSAGIEMTSVVVAAAEPLAAQLPDEVVLLNPEDGIYYGLDSVGARIWELISTPIKVADLHARLLDEYEVDPARLAGDLVRLLGQLRDRGLLELGPPVDSRPAPT